MIYYIADMHLGHANAIKFDNRPFSDVEEMDKEMIRYWNARVREDDDVYIVGDFCYRNGRPAETYLRQLKGHKHLIIGNHDGKTIKNPAAVKYFESVEQIGHISDHNRDVILCHYPIMEWPRMQYGAWHVYGHIHANTTDTYGAMRRRERALNAAACIIGYVPATLDELIEYNEVFKEDHPWEEGAEHIDTMEEDIL